jgi:hypothetical protein
MLGLGTSLNTPKSNVGWASSLSMRSLRPFFQACFAQVLARGTDRLILLVLVLGFLIVAGSNCIGPQKGT